MVHRPLHRERVGFARWLAGGSERSTCFRGSWLDLGGTRLCKPSQSSNGRLRFRSRCPLGRSHNRSTRPLGIWVTRRGGSWSFSRSKWTVPGRSTSASGSTSRWARSASKSWWLRGICEESFWKCIRDRPAVHLPVLSVRMSIRHMDWSHRRLEWQRR